MMVNRVTTLTKADIEMALTYFDEVLGEIVKNGAVLSLYSILGKVYLARAYFLQHLLGFSCR